MKAFILASDPGVKKMESSFKKLDPDPNKIPGSTFLLGDPKVCKI